MSVWSNEPIGAEYARAWHQDRADMEAETISANNEAAEIERQIAKKEIEIAGTEAGTSPMIVALAEVDPNHPLLDPAVRKKIREAGQSIVREALDTGSSYPRDRIEGYAAHLRLPQSPMTDVAQAVWEQTRN